MINLVFLIDDKRRVMFKISAVREQARYTVSAPTPPPSIQSSLFTLTPAAPIYNSILLDKLRVKMDQCKTRPREAASKTVDVAKEAED